MNDNIDLLAIGDTVIDAFIRLKDAEAYCDLDQENCKLCLRFGDKVPFESVDVVRAVGNSANAAVSASRLGLRTALVSDLGADRNGEECLETFKENGVDTRFISSHEGLPTNYHYVLWYGVERTILVKHAAFPYKLPADKDLGSPAWIYLSSLGENSVEYHAEIAAYLRRHPETKLAFQPGTFQMMLGAEALKDIYQETDLFFCNVEEARRILGPASSADGIQALMSKMHALGPKIVAITDGIKGAYASDGTAIWFMPVYPQEPFERTGAGDAFASAFTSAILLGKSVEEALAWGPINSMSVVQHVGAQKGLLTREKLEEYLENAPGTYKPTKL